jgi:hypothetical protein
MHLSSSTCVLNAHPNLLDLMSLITLFNNIFVAQMFYVSGIQPAARPTSCTAASEFRQRKTKNKEFKIIFPRYFKAISHAIQIKEVSLKTQYYCHVYWSRYFVDRFSRCLIFHNCNIRSAGRAYCSTCVNNFS